MCEIQCNAVVNKSLVIDVRALLLQLCPTLETLWTVAFQDLLFKGFSRQEY